MCLMCLYLPCLNMKAPRVCVWVCWKWRWEKIISQKILNCGTNVCELTLTGATLRDKCLRIQRKFANINPANISPAIICPALINTNKVYCLFRHFPVNLIQNVIYYFYLKEENKCKNFVLRKLIMYLEDQIFRILLT